MGQKGDSESGIPNEASTRKFASITGNDIKSDGTKGVYFEALKSDAPGDGRRLAPLPKCRSGTMDSKGACQLRQVGNLI